MAYRPIWKAFDYNRIRMIVSTGIQISLRTVYGQVFKLGWRRYEYNTSSSSAVRSYGRMFVIQGRNSAKPVTFNMHREQTHSSTLGAWSGWRVHDDIAIKRRIKTKITPWCCLHPATSLNLVIGRWSLRPRWSAPFPAPSFPASCLFLTLFILALPSSLIFNSYLHLIFLIVSSRQGVFIWFYKGFNSTFFNRHCDPDCIPPSHELSTIHLPV